MRRRSSSSVRLGVVLLASGSVLQATVACTGHVGEGSAGDAGVPSGGAAGHAGASSGGGQAGNGGAMNTTASGGSAQSAAGGASSSSGGAASVRDAGPGASTGGRSPDAAASNPCEGRIVCDDFEKVAKGLPPAKPWAVRTTQGKATVTVDDLHAVSGTHSVKVSIAATTASDTYRQAMLNIGGAPLIPLANNMVYGRFLIYTERIPDKSVHWTFAHGDGPQGSLTATYNYGGMGGLMANYYRNTTPDPNDCWQTKDVTFPTSKWTCVAFQFDGAKNEMRYWQDGVELPELHVLGNAKTDATCTVKGVDGRWLAPDAFKNINVGWESYQHDVAGAHDAWIDDVILDDQPIPCP